MPSHLPTLKGNNKNVCGYVALCTDQEPGFKEFGTIMQTQDTVKGLRTGNNEDSPNPLTPTSV